MPHDRAASRPARRVLPRVLCVVAHPDDMEYGTPPLSRDGPRRESRSATCCSPGAKPACRTRPRRPHAYAPEQQAACATVGVNHLTVLTTPTACSSTAWTCAGTSAGRSAGSSRMSWSPSATRSRPDGFDQSDHRAAGLAALDAVRDAPTGGSSPSRSTTRSRAAVGRWIIIPGITGDLDATHGVDVTGKPLQRGIASLEAHAAYLPPPGPPAPANFIPTIRR